ncbi:MAG TPA: TetR/AcrR family transcriptional regulator [Solirubrobacteraceae bacterium]|jgi:AcrR family transcriptional regulator|nr:TetR/AcrR family transcriptional regulator [Solirubrobacteraceae bacterium]
MSVAPHRSRPHPGLPLDALTHRGYETRQRIVAAATELFAERGYHATPISDVGDRAGVQRGALYYHIKSKEDLLFAVLVQHAQAMLQGVQEVLAQPLEAEEKLRRLVTYMVLSLLERQQEMTIYERDRRALTAGRLSELQDIHERTWQALDQILQEGVAAGTMRPIDPVVRKGLAGLIVNPHHWYRPGGPRTPSEIAEHLADFIRGGLAPASAK